jgi:DNA-binding NtrC family response regulator
MSAPTFCLAALSFENRGGRLHRQGECRTSSDRKYLKTVSIGRQLSHRRQSVLRLLLKFEKRGLIAARRVPIRPLPMSAIGGTVRPRFSIEICSNIGGTAAPGRLLNMTASILVVDDEPVVQNAVRWLLRSHGYEVDIAKSGEEALSRIAQQEFDVVVSDIRMPGLNGLDVLERSRALRPNLSVILMTGYASLETAIEALRRGASDYLRKPFDLDDLTLSVERALRAHRPVDPVRPRPVSAAAAPPGHHLVGESPAILAVREHIARCALTPSNVLITGESGVGKELLASAIHAASPQSERPFIAVNCGAIPETLIESQLFGHVRGAFTSALQANPGLFVAANHGTVFLDEIGELPYLLQVKLLRVIENREVWPVGATRPVPLDVRIIASTNRDLPREVEAGRFREDLFYRLNVVHISLPPLRERRGDIPLLVAHLLRRLNNKLGTAFAGVEPEALRALAAQPWRGNVRELDNVLERAMVLGSGPQLLLRHLAMEPATAVTATPSGLGLRDAVRQFELQHVRGVLARAGFDKREAARILEISLASLYRKLDGEAEPG